jgi:hypothetical protein
MWRKKGSTDSQEIKKGQIFLFVPSLVWTLGNQGNPE